MTAERRLARVEAALSPTELVLRWLDEAHAFGDLEIYVRSLLADGPSDTPLNRLVHEAAAGARAGARGKRAEVVEAAVRSAVRETVFRFELAMRINITAHELLEREALIDALLSAHLALLTTDGASRRWTATDALGHLGTCRDLAARRVSELRATREARETAEGRYLAGHPALFPDARNAWDEQLARTTSIADLAGRVAELDGLPALVPADPDAVADRVARLTADLVEPAKATTLETLGEGRQALTIATDWLRSRTLQQPDPDPVAPPGAATR